MVSDEAGDPATAPTTLGAVVLVVAAAAAIGLVAAFGVLSQDTDVEAPSSVWPWAVGGASIAAAGAFALMRSSSARRLASPLGLAPTLIVLVAVGALLGIAAGTRPAESPVSEGGAGVEVGIDRSLAGERPAGAAPSPSTDDEIAQRNMTDLEGSIALLIGLIGLIAVGVVFARRSELRALEYSAVYLASDLELTGGATDDDTDADALAAAIDLALEQMLDERDPRLAIRAAYGTLLAELDRAGLPKHPYEAPGEFAARCLRTGALDAADVDELLLLFQVARFSDHRVERSHADAARAALRRCSHRLRAVTT